MLTRIKHSIKYYLARQAEIRHLTTTLKDQAKLTAPQLIKLANGHAVWRVAVPGQPDRFMSATSGAINNEIFVVYLNTEAFYLAWLRSGPDLFQACRTDACVVRAAMPRDYKYRYAVDGFSHGIENPVPLAEIGAHQSDKLHIGFINGVTRTFWLIANYAPTFPVQVYGQRSTDLLNKVAGAYPAPMSFTALFVNQVQTFV